MSAPATDARKRHLLTSIAGSLSGIFEGGGGTQATLLASYDIADPSSVDSFTRASSAGYTTTGDADEWQREAAADTLRIHNSYVLLENDPTPCSLVAPAIPESVAPDGLDFSVSFSDIPVTASLLRYEWRLDGAGAWTDNGTSTAISGTSTAGSHVLNIRAVSTSGVAGATGSSASFDLVAAAVTPESFTGLTLWWDAEQESAADGTGVAAPVDWSGNSHTGNDQGGTPTRETNEVNGKATFRSNGTPYYSVGTPPTLGEFTFIYVMKLTSNGVVTHAYDNLGTYISTQRDGSSVDYLQVKQSDNSYLCIFERLATATAWTAYGIRKADASCKASVNGEPMRVYGSQTLADKDFTFDNLMGGAISINGDVSEIIIYDGVLSDSDYRSLHEDYLIPKYAVIPRRLVVTYGNSLVDGGALTKDLHKYSGNTHIDDLEVHKFGVSGHTIQNLIDDFPTRVQPILDAHTGGGQPIIALLEFRNSGVSGGTGGTPYSQFLTLIGMCRSAGALVLAVCPPAWSTMSGQDETDWNAICAALRTNSGGFHDGVIDLAGTAPFDSAANMSATIGTHSSDGTHLTSSGNDIAAPIATAAVEALL